ncbi:PLC-like phosphodiesterase [Acephala macrosclerotiorum]|nr:PLC-like phosphodiesterase [Acephala macrosclerotiorum]
MHFHQLFLRIACGLLITANLAFTGPGGHLEMVNLSPYDWKLTYQHSYHMDWEPWDLIPIGSKLEQYVEWWYHWGDNGDCAAEATYSLIGTDLSFTIQARQSGGKKLLVEYSESLAAMTLTGEKVIDLGFDHDGSVLFVLSGNGVDPYVSSQAPKDWMQKTLSTIGTKELREISMPMAHNAGMNAITKGYGGCKHNTACQTVPIYSQLAYGARWFDLRPTVVKGTWYTNHMSNAGILGWVGARGTSFDDIVNDINLFTAEAPGELIILQITHELDGDAGAEWVPGLPEERWQNLYKLLEEIRDLWIPSDTNLPDDLETLPISKFIQPGSKSAVIVRLPDHAPLPSSHSPAFIPEHRLPVTGDWIQTSSPTLLSTTQFSHLTTHRHTPKSPMFRLPWTITPRVSHMMDITNWFHSIIGEAMWAQHKLYQVIWDMLSKDTYPNLIEVDNVHNSQVAAICMVINQRFADAENWIGWMRGEDGEVKGLRWAERLKADGGSSTERGEDDLDVSPHPETEPMGELDLIVLDKRRPTNEKIARPATTEQHKGAILGKNHTC